MRMCPPLLATEAAMRLWREARRFFYHSSVRNRLQSAAPQGLRAYATLVSPIHLNDLAQTQARIRFDDEEHALGLRCVASCYL